MTFTVRKSGQKINIINKITSEQYKDSFVAIEQAEDKNGFSLKVDGWYICSLRMENGKFYMEKYSNLDEERFEIDPETDTIKERTVRE